MDRLDSSRPILVAGAGGFIGGHLIGRLLDLGFQDIRAVDIKPLTEWQQQFSVVENISADLTVMDRCREACRDVGTVFNLACDMGGMGFIENNKALCMISVLINTQLLMAAKDASCSRFFFSSSACVYNASKQATADVTGLKECDAYPAMPEDGYGWEKLFSERMCRHFSEDFGLETRVARFHNVYGPLGTWAGGREKAPAAICRKVIEAKYSGDHSIEIWGDGEQTRSFTYIDDCLHGIGLIMNSDVREPLNLGSDQKITINGLVSIVEDIAGIQLDRRYKLDAPKGVNGRNSDNTLIQDRLDWAPSIRLQEGMRATYQWIKSEYLKQTAGAVSASPSHNRGCIPANE